MTPEEYNEFCWSTINEHDYAFTQRPPDAPEPCPWCGGRYLHNDMCCEVAGDLTYKFKAGRYAGLMLAEVPRSWLEYVVVKHWMDDYSICVIQRYLRATAA